MDGKPKYRKDNTNLVQVPTESQWHGRDPNSVLQSPSLMHWPQFCLWTPEKQKGIKKEAT